MSLTENIIVSISLLILVVSSISIGYIASPEIEATILKIQDNSADSPEKCQNLSLERTAHCLNSYVKEIYKYKITQDTTKLTLEELIENGGDCKNYAELYYDMGNSLGFYVSKPRMWINENTTHMIATISDETGYCLLDQVNIKCFKFDNST